MVSVINLPSDNVRPESFQVFLAADGPNPPRLLQLVAFKEKTVRPSLFDVECTI